MPNQFTAPIWGDEGFSAILSMKPIPEIIEVISRDTSPPLFNITEHLWFQVFGTSEIAIRSLVFLYFLLAVFFTYKIASYLFNQKVGVLAAILTFLNPFFFTYAFEGRMYSILALGVTASMYFFLRLYFDKKPSPWLILGYTLSTLWALYSHHFAIFILLVQGLLFIKLLIKNRKKALYVFLGFITTGLGYTPWIIPLYNQTKMVGGGFWLGTPTFRDLLNLIFEYLADGIKHPLSRYALYSVFIIIALRKWFTKFEKTLVLLLWFLTPIIATWIISQFFQSIFFNRYLLYTIPAAMIILASSRRKFLSNLAILLTILLFLAIDTHYFTHPTKRPFDKLADYVLETKRGDDILVNWNASSHHLWETKYYGIPAPIYIPSEGVLPFFVGTALMEEDDIIREIPTTLPGKVRLQRVGVITSGPVEEVQIPNYTKSEVAVFGDLRFIWYEKTFR